MVKGLGHKMETNTKDNFPMIEKTGTGTLFGLVGINIKEHFLKILCMDKDVWNGPMEVGTKEIGYMEFKMVMVKFIK